LFVTIAANPQNIPIAQLDLYDLFLVRRKAKPGIKHQKLTIYGTTNYVGCKCLACISLIMCSNFPHQDDFGKINGKEILGMMKRIIITMYEVKILLLCNLHSRNYCHNVIKFIWLVDKCYATPFL
jgi:hypothetical protein